VGGNAWSPSPLRDAAVQRRSNQGINAPVPFSCSWAARFASGRQQQDAVTGLFDLSEEVHDAGKHFIRFTTPLGNRVAGVLRQNRSVDIDDVSTSRHEVGSRMIGIFS
jgi:hypothetical protein